MRGALSLLAIAMLAFSANAQEVPEEFGESTKLQIKAWESLAASEYEVALEITGKCISLFREEALKMQAELTEMPEGEEMFQYWALNDVGTCYFIRGQALKSLKRNEDALATFELIIEELPYSQAWDPRGWSWSVANAAATEATTLKALLENDF